MKKSLKWLKFRIKTIASAEDIIISTLYDIGLEGAQIEDNKPLTALEKEQMFVDIPLEIKGDDDTAYLSFFVEETDASENMGAATDRTETDDVSKVVVCLNDEALTAGEILDRIYAELHELRDFGIDIGEGTVAVSETEDIDWVNNWKQYFHQFTIDDVLVVPSWEQVRPEDRNKFILHIDPGTAFGTGAHETTQLCIRQLRRYITPETELLDVGTGSGILAILSLMFGARCAVGTDLDPCAAEAVADNCRRNGIDADRFEMLIGNIITEREVQDRVGYEKYDIVVANILADVLVPLTPVIVEQLKAGGIYITSGIIEGKESIVREAMEKAGFRIIEETAQGEWRCITAQKDREL